MGDYYAKLEDKQYVIYDGDKIVTTPAGHKVHTLYKPLADRIVGDLNKFGYSFHSASSILSWHFTMIDSFAPMDHDTVVEVLSQSFLSRPDWTCEEWHGSSWQRVFGDWSTRSNQISKWFEVASHMQLTAVCCIGNAYRSANIALELAKTMERFPAGDERDARFKLIAGMIANAMQTGSQSDIYNDYKTFELYYGIHLDQNGPILNGIVEAIDEIDDDENDLDVDDLTEYSVSIEQLIGRNYYHYTDYKKDEKQPNAYNFDEIILNESKEEDKEGEEEDELENEDDGLNECLPDDCWVKRFVDDNDPNTCYLLYLVVNDDGSIEDSGCIEETSRRMGGGGMVFMIPGMELPCVKSYDYNSFPPEKIMNDLKLLFAGHSIPLNFKFVGKCLPQQMINEGGNGGSNTEYTYALQSAFRLAYMHMSVDTTEDGVIQDFSYTSYQSSGDAYGDMFSRPMLYSDRRDEAMDMLLYIYDMYTDDEIAHL